MNPESLIVSGLLIAMFAAGFAGGWHLAKERVSRDTSFTDWVSFGATKKWVSRQTTPTLYAAYVEYMADEFDAIPKYDWPSKDRYLRNESGRPE